MHRFIPRAVILALIVAGFLAVSGAQALASDVRCGATITSDTRLKNDLVDCPGNGVVIGADNIALDLGGHTIDGDGVLGCTEEEVCDLGVDNTAGHHGVTIKNGKVREFATGIFVFGGDDNRLRRLSLSNNLFGGLLLIESMGTLIEGNSISANGLATDEAGLIVFDSSEIRIQRTCVADNGDIGMFVINVHDSRVERNSVSGHPETGMSFEGNGNEVSRNRVFRNGDGIVLAGDGNSVTRNRVVDAPGVPDEPVSGFGILVAFGDGNLLQGNDVSGAASQGIRLTADFGGDLPVTAEDNVVRDNRIERTGLDGILVDATASGSLLKRNRAIGAGDDGIDVESPTTTLTRNTANRNRGLGIAAVTGVTDGGGNRARGNGNPLECTNVFCR